MSHAKMKAKYIFFLEPIISVINIYLNEEVQSKMKAKNIFFCKI